MPAWVPPAAEKRERSPPPKAQSEKQQERKTERRRKATVEDAIEEHVPERAFIGDSRTAARNMANTFLSRCCKANLTPLAPAVMRGGHSLTFLFSCDDCDATIKCDLGKKQRLVREPVADSEEEVSDEDDEATDMQKEIWDANTLVRCKQSTMASRFVWLVSCIM